MGSGFVVMCMSTETDETEVRYRHVEDGIREETYENVDSVDIVGDSDGEHSVLIINHTDDRPNTVKEDVTDLYTVA